MAQIVGSTDGKCRNFVAAEVYTYICSNYFYDLVPLYL